MSKNNTKQGWQCPECGTVYAPHVSECSRLHFPTNKYVAPYWPYPYITPYPYQVRPYWDQPYAWWSTDGVIVSGSTATTRMYVDGMPVGSDTLRIEE